MNRNVVLTRRSRTAESITFRVSDVSPARTPLPEMRYREALEYTLGGAVESCSRLHGRLIEAGYHPLVTAALEAFSDHRPLTLSPDMIWLVLCQGFSFHVNANSEKLRRKVVRHQGRKTLIVRRGDFVAGSPENPWEEVFEEVSHLIRRYSHVYDIVVPQFSTTGKVEKAAFEVTLMEVTSRYFRTKVTFCGIPAVTLEGTVEDWEAVHDRCRKLAAFGLKWWMPYILPVLEQFVEAAKGRIHKTFWQSLYNARSRSGGPFLTGWLLNLFPYEGLDEKERNQELVEVEPLLEGGFDPLKSHRLYDEYRELSWDDPRSEKRRLKAFEAFEKDAERFGHGVHFRCLPSGLAKTPVEWEYPPSRRKMEFVAGFVGVRQDRRTLALRPEIGWAVRKKPVRRRGGW